MMNLVLEDALLCHFRYLGYHVSDQNIFGCNDMVVYWLNPMFNILNMNSSVLFVFLVVCYWRQLPKIVYGHCQRSVSLQFVFLLWLEQN